MSRYTRHHVNYMRRAFPMYDDVPELVSDSDESDDESDDSSDEDEIPGLASDTEDKRSDSEDEDGRSEFGDEDDHDSQVNDDSNIVDHNLSGTEHKARKCGRLEDELEVVYPQGKIIFEHASIADTGSMAGLIPYKLVKKHKLEYDPNDTDIFLTNASGRNMKVCGTCVMKSRPKYINNRLNKSRREVTAK